MQEQEFHSVRIPSCFEEADDLSNRIAEEANKCGYEEDSVFALRLSLEEALANAILHGNVRDESKHIRVRYQVTPERIDLYVADESFVTGTAAEIMPIVRIDSREIGEGRPGKITLRLLDMFRQETGS